MIDHKEFDFLGERAEAELGKLVDVLGLHRIVFEVESEKFWEHLKTYFRLFGPDANVANITPDQAFAVEPMRREASGGQAPA